ncbi:hypothetical protein ACIGO9_26740 [Nocardia asteroides]|uniref:hypothetical protein n=1 Tax=Nocardia asteroides TaxID=1824 RepID=UPI0037C93733
MTTTDPFESALDGTDPDRHASVRRVLALLADGRDHPAEQVIEATGMSTRAALDVLDSGTLRRPPVWRRQGERDPDSGSWAWTYSLPTRPRASERPATTPEAQTGQKVAQENDQAPIQPIETQPVGGIVEKPRFEPVEIREVPDRSPRRRRRTKREFRIAWTSLSRAQARAREIYGDSLGEW